MLHRDPATVVVPDRPSITRIDPGDPAGVRLGQELFAAGFGGRLEDLGPAMAAEVLRRPGMNAYVGRSDGTPCTVGLGALHGGHVGVFNIATPPRHRRHGHGHAVTAHVVAEGVAAGAHTAYLQASEMGYRRLRADGLPHRRGLARLLPGRVRPTTGAARQSARPHQPRARHSSRWGRSAPIVESSPWPG